MVQLEYEVGPLTVNLRVLLEPKGFLRIILLFVALVAFSTTAGFNSGSTANSLTCNGNENNNYTAYLTFSYPYSNQDYRIRVNLMANVSNATQCSSSRQYGSLPLSTSSQFFVAMGILTIIYVVAALLIYILFIDPKLFLSKWLVIGDFFVTIVFGVLYIIACIAWAAGVAQLSSYVSGELQNYARSCLGCTGTDISDGSNRTLQTFGQPAISLLLGFLASFIWLSTIWFVYKDTQWHKDQTGPLASLYTITEKSSTEKSSSPKNEDEETP